jgi:type I restriction enzyme S subunit
MSEWRIVRLADIAVRKGLTGGPFGSSLGSKDYVPSGIPVIRGVNLGSNGKFDIREFAYVTPEKVERELSRNLAKPGDVVFTQRGTLGQVGVVPESPYEQYVISQSQMRLRVDPDLAIPDFVYYQFRSSDMIATIHNNAITTGVPHINLGILAEMKLALPPLPVQRAISEVLGALDAKIAINDRIAVAASELARAHFSAAAKNAVNSIELRKVMDLRYGKALPEVRREPGPVPVFGGNGISGWHCAPLTVGPGIIIGRKGANAGSVSWSQGPFWAIDTAFYVEPTSQGVPLEYLFFLLEGVGFRNLVGDSAIPGLNREIALACMALLPPPDVIDRFVETARLLLMLQAHRSIESTSLAELRGALLPGLMSGAIRVRDAEKIVGDAT